MRFWMRDLAASLVCCVGAFKYRKRFRQPCGMAWKQHLHERGWVLWWLGSSVVDQGCVLATLSSRRLHAVNRCTKLGLACLFAGHDHAVQVA